MNAFPLLILGSVVLVLIGLGVVAMQPKQQSTVDTSPLTSLSALPTIPSTPSLAPAAGTPSATTAMQNFTELLIEETLIGTGSAVKSGDTVVIHYSGTLVDGTKFDSSYDRGQPFETQIGVGRVIAGWDQGIVGLKVGGKRRLKIPSALGYGERGAPPAIGPNASLIFDVELMAIK